jgi:CRISPR-associated exonuclease Cas4
MDLKITPTELLEYQFCPRFIYFMNVLKIPQNEERRYKVQKGREIHAKRLQQNKDYLWKKIGARSRQTEVYLISKKYHLRGIIDEVVTLADDTLAPIDYKYAVYPDYVYKSHKTQIICYCMMIEDVFAKEVKEGYIFYIREGNKQVTVPYSESNKNKVLKDIEALLEIVQLEKIPGPTAVIARCVDCTYKNICVR